MWGSSRLPSLFISGRCLLIWMASRTFRGKYSVSRSIILDRETSSIFHGRRIRNKHVWGGQPFIPRSQALSLISCRSVRHPKIVVTKRPCDKMTGYHFYCILPDMTHLTKCHYWVWLVKFITTVYHNIFAAWKFRESAPMCIFATQNFRECAGTSTKKKTLIILKEAAVIIMRDLPWKRFRYKATGGVPLELFSIRGPAAVKVNLWKHWGGKSLCCGHI